MLERNVPMRSQTPQAVRQELWGVLLAYNLVRREMEQVAKEANVSPLRISFIASYRLKRKGKPPGNSSVNGIAFVPAMPRGCSGNPARRVAVQPNAGFHRASKMGRFWALSAHVRARQLW